MKAWVDSLLHFVTHTNQGKGGREGNSCPALPLYVSTLNPPPLLLPLPITKDKVSSRLTGRRGGWPSWILWAERWPWQMGQLSSADLQGECFICLLIEGHVQHHKGGVSCRDQQPLHGSPYMTCNPLHKTSSKTICKHLAWWWGSSSRPVWDDRRHEAACCCRVTDAKCVYVLFGSTWPQKVQNPNTFNFQLTRAVVWTSG